jgi:hypothetical protein
LTVSLLAVLSAQEKEGRLRLPEKRIGLIVNFSEMASDLIDKYNDTCSSGRKEKGDH